MTNNLHQPRPRTSGDSEKITINLSYVDLGHIDLLVQDGFYSNRTDFIRTAIRNQLERHADATRQSVARRSLDLGMRHTSRAELVQARAAGQMLDIRMLGLAAIAGDVTPELARATIASLLVLGALQASPEVKAALNSTGSHCQQHVLAEGRSVPASLAAFIIWKLTMAFTATPACPTLYALFARAAW